jgi:hypothetical protein
MYEFHGWITVKETNGQTNNHKNITEIVKEIKAHIEKLNWGVLSGSIDIYPCSDKYCMWVTGSPNHKSYQESFSPIELFKYVGTISTGSYGILYVLDDEDLVNENDNYFKVFVLKNGKVNEYRDKFLSPVMPNIFSFPID